jgi:hypothetical protein
MEKLDMGIKDDIKNKKKSQASTKIAEMVSLKKMVQTMENKKHTFVKMKLQLEMATDDIDATQYFINI